MQNRPDKHYYLTFNTTSYCMAAKVQSVVEVLEKQRITKIPKAPKHIIGVISFRGEIIPVIDPRITLNLPAHPLDNFVIIVHKVHSERYNENLTVGVMVHNVSNVIEIKPLDIMPSTEINTIIPQEFTLGVFKDSERIITILNIDKILAIPDSPYNDNQQ